MPIFVVLFSLEIVLLHRLTEAPNNLNHLYLIAQARDQI